MLRPFLILPFFLAACGDNLTRPSADSCGIGLEPYAAEPDAFATVYLWVQDDPDLPKLDVKEGCELWLAEGIQCEVDPYERGGNVRVYASHDPCVEAPGGGYVLATAYGGGNIIVSVECMREWFVPEDDGAISRQALKLVVGHEVGHETGMWYHVPPSCDESAANGDFEKGLVRQGICGKALMNPDIDVNVCFITAIDDAAYRLRSLGASTIPGPGVAAMETSDGCILTVRPAP